MESFWDYFSFIGVRALSGVVNGLFYIGSTFAWPVLILLLLASVFIAARKLRKTWKDMVGWKRVLGVIGVVCTGVSVFLVGASFTWPLLSFSEIHLWTLASQTALAATTFICSKEFWTNLWWLLLAVSPSAFLQKMFINTLIGVGWDYKGTDDRSGRTWGMTLFGKRIKVPRLANMKVKLVIALICISVFLVVQYHHAHRSKRVTTYTGA